MKLDKRHLFTVSLSAIVIVMIMGCSSAKNTARTRWWQAFNTRYNVYFNGSQAYIDGSLEKETGNKDNYTEIIPLYTVGNKSSRDLGKGNFDRAIEKAEKAIHLHSIKRKPEWNKQRRKTDRDREWLSRREYNPFLWKAWMLMGRSQFHEGDFDAAASTFSYMSRLYETQPAIRSRAQAWLAKSYIENGYRYDAEDVIRNMRRDSIPWKARKEWDYALADYYIHTEEYDKAIPYLRKVIRHEMRRKQKAREWFLMGQLCQALGRNADAYKAYSKTIAMNPPYELEFNARILRTEVMASTKSKKMIGKLRRMARSDKNADYLDQVYYAIGNIYLAQKDTANAIASYEKGNAKGTRSGVEKGVLLLKLGDLYWGQEKYGDARRCYNDALGMLDKERPDYDQLSSRSKILDELVPYTDAIHLQDSLQELARMDETHRNAAIDRVIEALKKKEKEEQKLKDEQAAAEAQQGGDQSGRTNRNNQTNRTTPTARNNQQSSTWYFYNPTAVTQGKQLFQRTWGKRENIDNWQRNNKTVVSGMATGDEGLAELTDEQRDSIFAVQAHEDSLKQINDSAQNDPHRREYYMAQIPFTQEAIDASNVIIEDGLYHSGVIFKDKLDNLKLSEKALRRLTDHYPSYEHMDDVYYHLFLLYSRMGRSDVARTYVDSLKEKYPNSQWTVTLTDPNYYTNARYGEHLEDSLYAATYDAFKADRNDEVIANTKFSAERFPLGANRDKFLFIGALGKLNSGDSQGCLADMDTLVAKFPQSQLATMAGMIINGVKAGRKLRGGKFDIGDLWSRRTEVLSDSADIKQKQLSNERDTQFSFMFVYPTDSVNENKLLYQMAKYNFTSYLVRDFDIAIDDEGDLHRMRVSGFRSYDEALQYARQLYNQRAIVALATKARPVVVSDENLPLLGTVYSYDDYDKFYNKHFAPLKISTFNLLTEPAEVVTEPSEDNSGSGSESGMSTGTEVEPTETDVDTYLNDTFIGNDEPTGTTVQPMGTTVVPTETPVAPNGTTVTPMGTTVNPTGTTVVPVGTEGGTDIPVDVNNGGTNVPTGTTVGADEPTETTEETGTTVIPDEPVRQRVQQPVNPTQQPVKPAQQQVKPVQRSVKPAQQPVRPVQQKVQPGKQQGQQKAQQNKAQQKNNVKPKETKKPVTINLDDEYYELDGF